MEILVVKLSAIGDVVHTLPALDVLHRHFPGSNITWVVEEKAAELIKDHPYLKRVIVSRRKTWIKNLSQPSLWYSTLRECAHFIRTLRSYSFDLVIDFQGLLKSAVIVLLSRGKRKVGYCKTRELSSLVLNETIPPPSFNQHAVMRNLNLLRYLGAEPAPVTFPLFFSEEDKGIVNHVLSLEGVSLTKPLVVLHPQALWVTKVWSSRRMAELSDRLVKEYGVVTVLTGSRDDFHALEYIRSMAMYPLVNLAGKISLTQLGFLLSISRLMVSVDTGPMHIASALGVPLIALFGPTSPWRTGPFGENAHVIQSGLPCSPCFRKRCESRACMESISVEEVLEVAGRLIKEEKKGRVSRKGVVL